MVVNVVWSPEIRRSSMNHNCNFKSWKKVTVVSEVTEQNLGRGGMSTVVEDSIEVDLGREEIQV